MKSLLALVFFALAVLLVSGGQAPAGPQNPQQKAVADGSLTNKGVLDMVKGGLAAEVIIAKIEASSCEFDTSPSALTQMKADGASDAVILAMVKAPESSGGNSASTHEAGNNEPSAPVALGPVGSQPSALASSQPVKRPPLTWIRKVYLTGTKERAIKAGVNDLGWHTCLQAVGNAADADAIVVLEQSRNIMLPPDRSPSGVLNCTSTVRGSACTDTGSGETIAIDCTPDGSCQTSSYNAYAALEAAGAVTRALVNRSLSRATLLDKSHTAVLWLFDEGNREGETKGAGFYASLWWGELNTAVGCGKATMNPHKKWKEGQWPEPTAP